MVSTAKNGVVGAVVWSAARSWGTRIATLLVFLVLTRLLTPEDIGLVSYLLGWLTVLGVFADLGLAEYIVYNHQASKQTESGIWWFQVAFSMLLAAALVSVALIGWLSTTQLQQEGVWALMVLAITLPISAAAKIPEALLRRQMDYKRLALRSLVAISASSAIAIGLAMAGYGLWSLVAKQLIEVVIDVFYCFKFSQWRPALAFASRDLVQVFHGGWGIMSSRLLDVITQRADTLIIGGVFGMRDLGFYSIGQKVFQVLSEGVTQPVTGVIATAYGRVKADPAQLKQLFLTSVKFSAMLTAPIFMVAVALSLDWIPLVFGQQWATSAAVTQVFCLAGLMSGYTSLCGYVLLACNQNKSFFTVMLVNALVSLSLLAMLSQFGLLATAATLPLKIVLCFPLSFWLAQRLLGLTLMEYVGALKEAAVIVAIVAAAWLAVHQLVNLPAFEQASAQAMAMTKAMVILLALLWAVRGLYWQNILALRHALKGRA